MTTNVGVIGLGIMGSAMAANLMGAGYRAIGYDLLAGRRAEHRRRGGATARSAGEVARRARVILCSLPSSAALLEVTAELAALPRAARVIVETSTLPVEVKEEARRKLASRGATLLDCPLSGTGSQARARDIAVYASGPRAVCRRMAPVFEAIARAHYYVGPFGAGSKTKLVANLLVAIHNVAAAEALVLAMKAGLDPALTLRAIAGGVGSSRVLEVRGPMMVTGDYSVPTMKLDVWQKDMTVIADLARRARCPTPLFSATVPIYTAALAEGRGGEDTGAVCGVLEKLADYRRPAHRRPVAGSRRTTVAAPRRAPRKPARAG